MPAKHDMRRFDAMQQFDPAMEVTVTDAQPLIAKADATFLLDVRQPSEFETARIEGAYLCPLPEISNRLEEIRKAANGRAIVAYCHHGRRSLQATTMLREAGLDATRSMAGGIDAWSIHVDATVPRYGQ